MILLRLRLTFRVVFFYSAMYVVCAGIILYKNFGSMMKKMKGELRVVWYTPTPIQPLEEGVTS